MSDVSTLTNHFPKPDEAFSGTLTTTIAAGATTVAVTGLSSYDYSDGDFLVLTIEPNEANEAVFSGIKSGNSLTGVKWHEGNIGVGHTAGASIVDYVSATHIAAITKGLLEEHKETGAHSNITADSVAASGNGSFGGSLEVTDDFSVGDDAEVGGNLEVTGEVNAIGGSKEAGIATSTIRDELLSTTRFITTGLNPSSGTALTATIPAGVAYINGKRVVYAGGTKLLTANKDCYIDIDENGAIFSVEVNNGVTTGMTLTANSARFAKIVTGASISSYTTSGYDPLGNRIRNVTPFPKELGLVQLTSGIGSLTSTSYAALTGLTMTVIVPPSGKIRLELDADAQANSGANHNYLALFDTNTAGTQVGETLQFISTGSANFTARCYAEITGLTPGASKTYICAYKTTAGTMSISAAAYAPITFRATDAA